MNYKGSSLKKLPQTTFETTARLETNEFLLLNNDLKRKSITTNYPRPDSKPPLGLKILKSVYETINYEGNLLKALPQIRFETARPWA